jgi:hypothetical protein
MDTPQFSRNHVLEALRSSQEENIKVAPNAPVFLAAVLEHVTHRVLRVAGENSTKEWKKVERSNDPKALKLTGKKRIRQQHLADCFLSDKELRSLVGKKVFIRTAPSVFSEIDTKEISTQVIGKMPCPKSQTLIPLTAAFKDDNGAIIKKYDANLVSNIRNLGVESIPDVLDNLLLCTMGLPGCRKTDFMEKFKKYIDEYMKKKFSVHLIKNGTNEKLFQAKAKSPKEVSFAWHTHVLTSCAQTLDNCCESRLYDRRTLCMSDCSFIECFSQALSDFGIGNLSKFEIDIYHTFFLDSVKLSRLSRVPSDTNNAARAVIILYIAANPVTCRQNMLKADSKTLRAFDSINELESLCGRNLEVISQQCAYKRNVLVISQRMLSNFHNIFYTLLGVRSGQVQLPTITFNDIITVRDFDSKLNYKDKAWVYQTQTVVYDTDEVIFESYSDLCKGRWSYSSLNANGVFEPFYNCKMVYVNKQFWIIRSPYVASIIFEHMSRGQNIVVYSTLQT